MNDIRGHVTYLKLKHGELQVDPADRLYQHLAILDDQLSEYVDWLLREHSAEIELASNTDPETAPGIGWRRPRARWARALDRSSLHTIAEYLYRHKQTQ